MLVSFLLLQQIHQTNRFLFCFFCFLRNIVHVEISITLIEYLEEVLAKLLLYQERRPRGTFMLRSRREAGLSVLLLQEEKRLPAGIAGLRLL